VACRKPVPEHVAQVAASLDTAAARNMQTVFEGGAEFTPHPAETRREALRLAIGRMLRFVVERLERPDQMLHLYSGHDWTVTPLLLAVCRHDEPALRSGAPRSGRLHSAVFRRIHCPRTPRVHTHMLASSQRRLTPHTHPPLTHAHWAFHVVLPRAAPVVLTWRHEGRRPLPHQRVCVEK